MNMGIGINSSLAFNHMNQNKFQRLIEVLKIDPIIFIDNDFGAQNINPGKIIFEIHSLPFLSKNEFYSFLDIKNIALSTGIKSFLSKVKALALDENDTEWFEAGELSPAFVNKYDCIIGKEEIDSLTNALQKEFDVQTYSFEELLMSVGISNAKELEVYKYLIDEIKSLQKDKNIKYYKGLAGPKLIHFINQIQSFLKNTESQTFLLVVDKVLDNEDGLNVVQSIITAGNKQKLLNFISIIYTSREAESLRPINADGHLLIQIRKPGYEQSFDETKEKLSQSLAYCAYGLFFRSYLQSRKTAINTIEQLLFSSEGAENVIFLAEQAHQEGTTVFNTINSWVELASSHKIAQNLAEGQNPLFAYRYIVNLTSLLTKDFFSLSNFNSDGNKLEDLSTFEIYDEQINNFHKPLTAGDIFEINNNIFILAGQECDLIVRENGGHICRREQLAELIYAEFDPDIKGKNFKTNDAKNQIEINHFSYKGQQGILRIFLNNRQFYDFRLLDLTVLYENGIAKLPKTIEDYHDQYLLPKMWQEYLPFLISSLNERIHLQQLIQKNGMSINLLFPNESLLLEGEEKEDSHYFPIVRLSRLKDNFNRFFIVKLNEYKNRIALNTIKVHNKEKIKTKLKYGFSGNSNNTSSSELAALRLLQNKAPERDLQIIVNKNDIMSLLPEPFRTIFQKIPRQEIILNEGKTEFLDNSITVNRVVSNKSYEITIIFALLNKITGQYFHAEQDFDIFKLIGESNHEKLKKSHDIVINRGAKQDTYNKDVPSITVKMKDLKDGMEIPLIGLSLKLDLDNGILNNSI
jgi:hypothetical protein